MSSTIALSEEAVDALQRLRERREVNTVVLRRTESGLLGLESEGNLTHDELVESLPPDGARLVVHELSFATPEGKRKQERLLIFWMPSPAGEQEESYAPAFTALREFLTNVHVHLTARRKLQLEYRRLVALVG